MKARPTGWVWAGYFLRANGELVVVGADCELAGEDSVSAEPGKRLRILVWDAERYPELRPLIPVQGPGAVDCRCRAIPISAEGKVFCPDCGGLGWSPDVDGE